MSSKPKTTPQSKGRNDSSKTTDRSASKLEKQRQDFNQFHDPGIQVADGDFPAQYHSRPEADRVVGLKQDYIRHLNQYKPDLNAKYDVSDGEVDALVRRYSELDLINFERYISAWFDTGDPTHQRLINELYPQYFERRLDQIEANLEVQRRVAHLKLLGPRNADDLRFAYLLETGVVTLPTTPVFDVSKHNNATQRGLFNPKLLFGGDDNTPAKRWSKLRTTGTSGTASTGAAVTGIRGWDAVGDMGIPDALPANAAGFGTGVGPKSKSPLFDYGK